jgi:signal transduction histidine kinase
MLEFRVTSVLAWPLTGQSGAGWLFCLDKPHLTSDDLSVGSIAAREVAASIEHFNLTALSRHLAVQEARTRLGRDLHDGLLQALTAARLQLYQLARGLGATGSPDARSRLSAMEATLAANQRELRLLVEELRHAQQAPAASAGDAGDTLAALRERMKADWNLTVGEMNLAVEVTEDLRRELVLLLQEALVNAARHGRATQAEIRSEVRDGTLVVQVRDNGAGFGFAGRRSADELLRLGVCPTSIRDRLAGLSGSLAVESSDQGACIDMRIPLHTEARVGNH